MRILKLILIVGAAINLPAINNIQAQSFARQYWNKLVNDTSDVANPQLLVYPTLAYAPETSWEFGLSGLYVYYANRDTSNRLSEINGFTFLTLENQYGLWFDHAIYSDRNTWFFLGRMRLQSFPLFYHGIGMQTPKSYIAQVEVNQIAIKERILRQLHNNLFIGFEIDYQRLSGVNFIWEESNEASFDFPLGSNGLSSIGLGFGLVHDDRHNVLNVRKGLFSEQAILHYDALWGSTYTFTSYLSDTRLYRPIGKQNVLAMQLFGQFNTGDVPFNQLALMGGESIMRGYYYGRYRDKNQVATQIEFRFLPIPFHFTNRIGAAVFAGTGTVFEQWNEVNPSNFVFSGGAGLRFLLFPKKDIWTRLDFAFTKEGNGIYLFIGEAF